MNSASKEWMARVAARNEIETAKALRAGTPADTRPAPLSAGTRPTWWKPLSPEAELAATVRRQKGL